ncbi:MAG: sugar kinase, partial [Actinomycetota bacterium]|nr:sugar kinase [Actinomycetota bacterium]
MVARSGATQEEVRRHNLATLLTVLHTEGATSRAGLTVRMGLNRSTIRALTADLVARGLVRELHGEAARAGGVQPGPGQLGTGRPSHVVVPESERVFVLAVDISVTDVVVARVGLGGRLLERRERRHSRGGAFAGGLADVVADVGGMGRELLGATDPRAR